jgi:hypothetical protein
VHSGSGPVGALSVYAHTVSVCRRTQRVSRCRYKARTCTAENRTSALQGSGGGGGEGSAGVSSECTKGQ